MGAKSSGHEFVGRKAELKHLRECCALARTGQPYVVLVEGEAGIGKTSLVRQCLVDSDDFTVLWATCDLYERDFSFGVVSQLTARVKAAKLARLPLLAAGPKPDVAPFQVGAELIALLDALQKTGPVVMVVDDLQWADEASIRTLGFVVRRLLADRVLTILSTRTRPDGSSEESTQEWKRLITGRAYGYTVQLAGLGVSDVAQMAARMGARGLIDGAVGRLHQYTGGHPLHVQTVLADVLPKGLTWAELPLSAPAPLAALVRRKTERLPADSRSLLEALAVLDGRYPLGVVARMAAVTDPARALEPLLGGNLVQWWPMEPATPVQIRHALQRDAIYQTMSPQRHRELHAAAVTLVGREAAWAHRVAGAMRTDPDLAIELEAEGQLKLAAHDVDRGANLLLWAAELSGTRAEYERRLLTACVHSLSLSRSTWALRWREAVESCVDSPLRNCAAGMLAYARGEFWVAKELLTQALDAAGPGSESAWITGPLASYLAGAHLWLNEGRDCVRIAGTALKNDHLNPYLLDTLRALRTFGRVADDDPLAALRELSHLPDEHSQIERSDLDSLVCRGLIRAMFGQLSAAAEDLTTAVRHDHAGANMRWPHRAYSSLAMVEYLKGAWDEATVTAEQAVSISDSCERFWAQPIAHMAATCVPAGRGDWETAEAHVAEARRRVGEVNDDSLAFHVAFAQAILSQARNDPQKMLAAFESSGPGSKAEHVYWKVTWKSWRQALLAEALLGCHRVEEAKNAIEGLRTASDGVAYQQLVLARLDGWLSEEVGDTSAALATYRKGVELPVSDDDAPLYRAMLEHSYGRLLSKTGDNRAAVHWLESAREHFTALDARPFLERCVADLVACVGPVAGSPPPGPFGSLTDRERVIAHLVARGATNKEAAKELYVSTKTVEYHLARIFMKLGITSRRELRRFGKESVQ